MKSLYKAVVLWIIRTARRCARWMRQLSDEMAKIPLEVRKHLFEFQDFPLELIRLQLRPLAATAARNCRVSLRLTHRYFDWLRAVRTRGVESRLG
jgi:hypothetical protein